MEKLSCREKMALGLLLVILLLILTQLFLGRGESKFPPKKGVISDAMPLNFSGQLLQPGKVGITASSHNLRTQLVDKLLDFRRTTFWHVALAQIGKTAWVTIDFGPGKAKNVKKLMALPRQDCPRQFFRSAQLLGSDDGEDWEAVSEIIQTEPPVSATWQEWCFDNSRSYRYYRFQILDGHEEGRFYSMAELALFE